MVGTVTERIHPSSKPRNALFLVTFAAISLAVPTFGQSTPPAPETAQAKTFAYDVVSIKPHRPGDGNMYWGPTREGYQAVNVTVALLVRDAYDIKKLDLLSGLPKWSDDARFDLEAKLDEDTATALRKLSHQQQWETRQRMLQAVLADRFRLSVHKETQDRPIYALVIAKGGPRLTESHASEGWWNWSGPQITMHAEPMAIFASWLSRLSDVDRVVVDRTGLTADYDFTVKWTPDPELAKPDAGPSIFTALEEQLGLKLVPAKGPVDTLVIDHVERPSEN